MVMSLSTQIAKGKDMMNAEQCAQALKWYAQGTANLQTIAQHYGLTVEQLSCELRTAINEAE